ncbi:hypothetical protein PsorP6_013356 [Peronosclerospora sorghi]|uniref:Uncharacterized protein n=1 Tax=Peronosclerospora sorghi TaxID=230839 RepID=A0ACC0WFW4_9STRA|nr:hypothetical protein PsorP6_013356 [Peronosclerospora sorghi]
MTSHGVQDDDDSEEPDPKLLRLTEGYDIALAVMEIPRIYNEAVVSPQAYKWKEEIRRELRSHLRNHTWDAIRRPGMVNYPIKSIANFFGV